MADTSKDVDGERGGTGSLGGRAMERGVRARGPTWATASAGEMSTLAETIQQRLKSTAPIIDIYNNDRIATSFVSEPGWEVLGPLSSSASNRTSSASTYTVYIPRL